MVDLDQCTHATINGCDKEQQGWYPLPSSLSPFYLPPLMPIPLPPAQLFLSDARSSASALAPTRPQALRRCRGPGVPLMAGVPDEPSAASIHLPRPAPWENSEPSFYQAYHEITASSPPRPPSSTLPALSFSPTLTLAVSHMLISHGCTPSLPPYRQLSAFDLLRSS
ncbi:Alpha-2B adrenergic receptor [Dissostichus eleginoides]|uniref:Alpha-2B adrenergic receptor n=1 Tax=Dissostichus eleginoides TaxID=100907 RepID=A0AAD9C1W9_DISEL|nr:Alpha-2B adrenergic receptor [Dissostichus eleginoides]